MNAAEIPEREWKRADLPDEAVIRAVEAVNNEHDCWAFTAHIADSFPDAPFKVVAAKLARLAERGLVTGCPCGCRGDWEVTHKGRELAGITTARRPNPMVDDYAAECDAFTAMTARPFVPKHSEDAFVPHEVGEGCLDCPHPDICAGMGKCEIGAAELAKKKDATSPRMGRRMTLSNENHGNGASRCTQCGRYIDPRRAVTDCPADYHFKHRFVRCGPREPLLRRLRKMFA